MAFLRGWENRVHQRVSIVPAKEEVTKASLKDSRGIKSELNRRVVCEGTTRRANSLCFYDVVKTISKTPDFRPNHVIRHHRHRIYYNVHEIEKQITDMNKKESRKSTAEMRNNTLVFPAIIAWDVQLSQTPRKAVLWFLIFPSVALRCSFRTRLSLLPLVVRIIVKDYGARSFRKFVCWDLRRL